MRALFAFAALMLLVSMPARADPPKLAMFDFELLDTSLEGEMGGPQADEQRSADPRQRSGAQAIDGIRQVPAPRHLAGEGCGGRQQSAGLRRLRRSICAALGADLVITGVVQKISDLDPQPEHLLRDVHTGQLITAMNADLRGNTDESWSRATSYLVRNRLLAPNYGKPQP